MKRVFVRGAVAVVDDDVFPSMAEYSWGRHSRGYIVSARAGLLHRFVMGLSSGDKRVVDHINGDKMDNRRCNLRVVSQHENVSNSRRRSGKASPYRGVHKNGRKGWAAEVMLRGRRHYLGTFRIASEAASAYDRWVIANKDAYAATNLPRSHYATVAA